MQTDIKCKDCRVLLAIQIKTIKMYFRDGEIIQVRYTLSSM